MTKFKETLAREFSKWNRKRKLARTTRLIEQWGVESLLLVGPGGAGSDWEGMIERGLINALDDTVACGLDERTSLPVTYVRADACYLPFADKRFDLVFSNAVIEHVGGIQEQSRFIREHVRVGRHWIVTTPNRWFPVEPHTHALFRHYSPAWREKRSDKFSRLLTPREFAALIPEEGGRVVGSYLSPTLMAFGWPGQD